MAQVHGKHPQLLQAVMEINDFQRKRLVLKLEDIWGSVKGKTVGLLGLAFKENTDDMRESPSITIGDYLNGRGAIVRGYDPVAMTEAAHIMPYLQMAKDAYALAQGADALIVMTPWNEFKNLDLERIKAAMAQPVIIDGRNLYDPADMAKLGFTYRGVGRGYKNGQAD
jgi:UDPglucose 6-dehydrogenase